jgi:hypothetical protein
MPGRSARCSLALLLLETFAVKAGAKHHSRALLSVDSGSRAIAALPQCQHPPHEGATYHDGDHANFESPYGHKCGRTDCHGRYIKCNWPHHLLRQEQTEVRDYADDGGSDRRERRSESRLRTGCFN